MPPAPYVMSALYMEYKRKAAPGTSFNAYLEQIGFVDPSITTQGMDDRLWAQPKPGGGIELLALPTQRIIGSLQVMVLLVDFEDKLGYLDPAHYEDLLFSQKKFPTGSMRDYFAEVSRGAVDVVGTVHGWLRMPSPYSHYVNNESGTGRDSYPRSCKRLAEDAVELAKLQGIEFPPELDKLGREVVTALFIVHAGRGAEYLQTVAEQKTEIWSHKWNFEHPVTIRPGLSATTYLVVPQGCKMGVCAHELGHLAFQWQDFYDPNYKDDGEYWDGSGSWDLMASGSHNHGGVSPAHPAALHKVQHGWVPLETIKASKQQLRIKPVMREGGGVVKIVSKAFKPSQYLLLENRRLLGFDRHLPGEGLLVWRVDESLEMFSPANPGMKLIQADGLQQLDDGGDYYEGDDGDPFPGRSGVTVLTDSGEVSTSFPGAAKSGIRLSNIAVDNHGDVTLDVTI